MNSAPIIGWYGPLLALFVTALSLRILLRTRLVGVTSDQANDRSLHKGAIPRIGGIGIAIGLAATLIATRPSSFTTMTIVISYTLLLLVSLFDDVYRLSIAPRLLTQTAVAGGCAATLGFSGIGLVLCILALVWAANLYNFMDGSDGLAGGMAVIGFGCYCALALLGKNHELAMVCASIAGAALAFLWFNFYPAKLFMGDSGSIPLGFCAALIGIFGWQEGCWPWWLPVIVFFPFIFDASFTLLFRILKREAFWQAHRQHIYQRAILQGLGHRRLAWYAYVLMLICSGLGAISTHLNITSAGLIMIVQTVSGLFFAWLVRRKNSS